MREARCLPTVKNWTILILTTFLYTELFLSASLVAVASSPAFQQEVARYQNGDYDQAREIGLSILNQNPSDSWARCYLANSLACLNRKEDAITEYTKCLVMTHDKKLYDYCKQAIKLIQSGKFKPPVATAKASPPIGRPISAPASATAPALSTASSSRQSSSVGDASMLSRKAATLEEGNAEIAFVRKQADRDIAQLQKDETEQLSTVAQGWPRNRWINGMLDTWYEPNPDYPAFYKSVHDASLFKISEVNRLFEKRKAEITANYKKKADAYDDVVGNAQSQFKPGTSSTQAVPSGANAYVRNVVNYSVPSGPQALRARSAK